MIYMGVFVLYVAEVGAALYVRHVAGVGWGIAVAALAYLLNRALFDSLN